MQDYGTDEIYMGNKVAMDRMTGDGDNRPRVAFVTFGCRLNKAEALDPRLCHFVDRIRRGAL